MTHAKVSTAILVALMATPVYAMLVRNDEPPAEAKPVIIKLQAADGAQPGNAVFTPGDGKQVVVLRAHDDAGGQDKVIALQTVTKDIEPGGPWLGIQFGPVAKPLASHLALPEDEGQMVLNVAEGSPADQAGLQQYDVIVSIDGAKVTSDLSAFLDTVRGFAPNETHTFTLKRGGQTMQVNIVVGSRPEDWANVKYKYEMDIETGPFQGRVMRRGGLLQKDDQGNWTFNQLDDEGDDMPDVWSLLPDPDKTFGSLKWHQALPGHGNQFQFFSKKGLNVKVERNDDGSYTVTRTEMEDGNEKTTTETFANEAEFKAKYPNGVVDGGHDIFFHMQPFDPKDPKAPRMFQFKVPGPGEDFEFDIKLDADIEAMLKDHEKLLEESQALLDGAKQKRGIFFGPHGAGAGAKAFVIGTAATTFEIQGDGSIRVVTRNEGDELVETFANGDALKAGRPDLYERYQKLMDVRQAEIDKAATPAGR